MILPDEPINMRDVVRSGLTLFQRCFVRVFPWAVLLSVLSVITVWQSRGMPPDINQSLFQASFTMLVSISINLLITIICLDEVLEQGKSLKKVLGLTLRLLPLMVVMYVLFALAVLAGFLLLVIPGFILMLTLLPASTLFVIARLGPLEALTRSHKLVWGNFWRTANIYSMFTLLVLVPLILLLILALQLPGPETTLLDRTNLLSALVTPWLTSMFTCVSLVLVNDLLLRTSKQTLKEIAVYD